MQVAKLASFSLGWCAMQPKVRLTPEFFPTRSLEAASLFCALRVPMCLKTKEQTKLSDIQLVHISTSLLPTKMKFGQNSYGRKPRSASPHRMDR